MFLQIRKSVLGGILVGCAVFVLGISGSVILLTDSNVEPKFNVSGLVPAVFTSLNDDQTVNLDVIPAYVDYLINNKIKAVLVGGSSGEHMALTVADRKRIIDAWLEASRGTDLHLQVQVGGAAFPDVVDLTVQMRYLTLNRYTDLYAKPHTVEDLVDYVELVAKAAPTIPLFYYHIPKKTFVNVMMPEFVQAASARIKNFKGIKFTSNDLVEAAQVLKVLRKDQKFFLGGEHVLAPAALLGIDSCISPAINLFPGTMQNILEAVRDGDSLTARELQDQLSSIINDISAEGGRIPSLKVAMESISGIAMRPPALPSKPVTAENRKTGKVRVETRARRIEKQRGLMPAVLTTLNDDQSVNLDVIPEYVKYLHSNKTTCILLGGSSGEHMNLSVEDRKRLITSWQDACAQYGIHVQVQVGGAPFADVIDLTKFCESVGVGSVVTLPDPYDKPATATDLADYVAMIAAAAPSLPVFYYHNPVKTFVAVNMAKFVKAAGHIKNFGGVKFTSTNLAEALEVLRVIKSNQKFIIGGEQILAPAALIGIDSCMSPMINLFPDMMQRILDAVQGNRLDEARQLQAVLSGFVSDISAQGGRIPAMKVAMEILSGIKMGPPALPTKPVTAENRLIIDQKIKELRHLLQEKGS